MQQPAVASVQQQGGVRNDAADDEVPLPPEPPEMDGEQGTVIVMPTEPVQRVAPQEVKPQTRTPAPQVVRTQTSAKPQVVRTPTPAQPQVAKTQTQMPQAAKPQASKQFAQPVVAPKPKSATAVQTEEYAGDYAAGEDFWKQALDLMKAEKKNSMVSCARSGRVYSFVNNLLQVAFKAPFLADRMNKDDYRKAFEDALLRIARRPIRLEAVIAGRVQPAGKPVAQETPQAAQTQALEPDQLPKKLQQAVNAFGGTVTDISAK